MIQSSLLHCRLCHVEKSCGNCFETSTISEQRLENGARLALCRVCFANQNALATESVPLDIRMELEPVPAPNPQNEEKPSVLKATTARLHGPDHRERMNAARRSYEVFNANGERLHLANVLAGRSIFLLVNGPSLNSFDLSKLNGRGMVTMGLNNGPAVFKPNYWVSLDGPQKFIEQIWLDPTICKFAPMSQRNRRPRLRASASDNALIEAPFAIESCPNVHFFARSQSFDPATFLTEPQFNWGAWNEETDSLGIKGGRTTMLVALKLCFWLGARNCYIVGADFQMSEGAQNYAFEQSRTPASVRGNNSSYRATNQRLRALRPHFGAAGFTLWNCTPNSGLTAFALKSFDEAVAESARECNEKPIVTAGLYD